MQKCLITLIILLFTYSTQGQVPFDELLKPKSIRKLEQFVSKADELRSDTSAYWHYLRTLSPGGYLEGVLRITIFKRDKNDPNRATINDYSIHLLTKGDPIFYYQICKEYWDTTAQESDYYFKPIAKYADPQVFSSMQKAFHSFFEVAIDTNDLFLTDFPFGTSCGATGTPPEGQLAINRMLLLKDKTAIGQWLRSPNTEKQLYAAFALQKLNKQGIRLNKTERSLMRFISRKRGSTYNCAYCTYGTESIRRIVKFTRKNPGQEEPAREESEE